VNKLKEITIWTSRLLWPTLIIISWWSFRVEDDLIFRLITAFLVLSSILFAWWQKRLYLAAISVVFIGLSGLFVYLQNAGPDGLGLITSYIVLIYILTVACFAAFATYTLKVLNPFVLVYLVGVIFICLEFFWILASIAADPIIRALLVTGLFHLMFTMVALYSWKKLEKKNFRWYLVGATLFFAIFIRLM